MPSTVSQLILSPAVSEQFANRKCPIRSKQRRIVERVFRNCQSDSLCKLSDGTVRSVNTERKVELDILQVISDKYNTIPLSSTKMAGDIIMPDGFTSLIDYSSLVNNSIAFARPASL